MIIVTGAPCSGKSTLCQSIDAVELSVDDAIQKARSLKEAGKPCTVIFLACYKEILINRAMSRHGTGAMKHIAEILSFQEPMIQQLRTWFEDFIVLHTDGGIDLNVLGAFNDASRDRRIEIPADGAQTPRLL